MQRSPLRRPLAPTLVSDASVMEDVQPLVALAQAFVALARAAGQSTLQAEEPLRSQLFNAEQMESHGKALTRSHHVHARAGPERLLDRLEENEGLLDDASTVLTRMVQDEMRITPAGEWLLDNYYLIEEQIRTARRHLPKGYSRELPPLSHGPSAGLPRVYDLSLEAIAMATAASTRRPSAVSSRPISRSRR